MFFDISLLALASAILASNRLVLALSPSEIPSDIPISSLIASAGTHLSKGETNEALTYYDIAISRDPENYSNHFRRGAAYLSVGRTAQAILDFDKVLAIKPDHNTARLQRANIRARNGEWDLAEKDYLAHGQAADDLNQLQEAKGAAALASDAEKARNWEECVTQAGVAIMVAGKNSQLRKIRSKCRFERGEVLEAMTDLKFVLQMQPGLTEPHLSISAISFYGLGSTDQGLEQLRKCLHSDPDSKSCKKLYRREKNIEKQFAQVKKFFEKRRYSSGVDLLVPSKDETGLLQDIKDDIKELRQAGTIPEHTPNDLILQITEMICEGYYEMKSKKAAQACQDALALNENALFGLLHKSRVAMEAENYEAAISELERVKDHHPAYQHLNSLLQNAHTELKRSKTKDYYKVLQVPRDSDERQIKAAYRKMTRANHPDKAHKLGIAKEDAERKMAAINEAYEVLSSPELKERYDRGDDPNDHSQQGQHPFHGSPFGQGGHHGGQQFSFKFQHGGFPGFG